jgi:threonyl-tRNA synthetase
LIYKNIGSVGDKEVAGKLVAVRARSGEDLGQMTLEALLQRLLTEIDTGSTA